MVRTSRFVAAFALAAAALVTACTSGADLAASSGSGAGGESDWEKVVSGGDCECADGSEFSFWARDADPTKVVFYLDGGGACIDATTCAFTGDGYDWNAEDENPARELGMFELDRADNPVRRLFLRVRALMHRGHAPRRRHPRVLA